MSDAATPAPATPPAAEKLAPKYGQVMLTGGTLTVPFRTEPAGPHGPLSGRIRPAAPREVARYAASCDAVPADRPEDLVPVRAAFYAGLIQSWDAAEPGADGAPVPVPVTPAAVERLPAPVWAQLEAIALGYAGATLLGN